MLAEKSKSAFTKNKDFYVVEAENWGTLSLVVTFPSLISPLFTFQYLNAVQIKHYNLKQAKRGCNMAKNRSVDYIPGKPTILFLVSCDLNHTRDCDSQKRLVIILLNEDIKKCGFTNYGDKIVHNKKITKSFLVEGMDCLFSCVVYVSNVLSPNSGTVPFYV